MIDREQEYQGLSSPEASERLKKFGANELPSSKPRSVFAIALNTLREPMFLLLISCSLLYILIGDWGESLLLSAAIFLVMLITFVQERRTERTLDALRDLSSPRALVIRDGQRLRIAGRDLVPDDRVIIAEGDRIPADGFVLDSKALLLNESLLTGESVSVRKTEWNGKDELGTAGGEDSAFVFSGTLVVQGSGSFQVKSTGTTTAMGRIGSSLSKTARPTSTLQEETKRVVRLVAFASLTLSVGIAIAWWLRNQDILRGILMGLTFAMSTIPEEFPVVLTIFMALGAWRISKQKVLTREMNAIEALGAASYLCVDKTGTLTENRMTAAALWTSASSLVKLENDNPELSDALKPLVQTLALASDPKPSDPMDLASVDLAKRLGLQASSDRKLIKSFPLVRPLLAVGYAWSEGAADESTIFVKGAPEAILSLCRLAETEAGRDITRAMQSMASQGYRVLGAACTDQKTRELKEGLESYAFDFVGLVGFSDPVKAGVPEAIQQCHEAGIRVMMITGDYPTTALSIAAEIGLENAKDVITGDELSALSDEVLAARLKDVRVLARMVPEQKLRIVQVLRQSGEVVAMTGDGVNDAPALKASHIGIAMGGRGTDVAREAAALVLLNDDFTSIVAAIRLGRRIYDNIQKSITYIIAIHVPIIGLTILPLILGVPPILWPVHLAFLELIVDPVCSIVFEAETEEPKTMKRPPRPLSARLFGRTVVTAGLVEGVVVFLSVFAVYYTVGNMGEVPDHARAIAFATLIFANFVLIITLSSRTESAWAFIRRPNPTLRWIGLALLFVSAFVLYTPGVVGIFHFASPHAGDIAMSAGVALLSLLGFETLKFMRRRKRIRVVL